MEPTVQYGQGERGLIDADPTSEAYEAQLAGNALDGLAPEMHEPEPVAAGSLRSPSAPRRFRAALGSLERRLPPGRRQDVEGDAPGGKLSPETTVGGPGGHQPPISVVAADSEEEFNYEESGVTTSEPKMNSTRREDLVLSDSGSSSSEGEERAPWSQFGGKIAEVMEGTAEEKAAVEATFRESLDQ